MRNVESTWVYVVSVYHQSKEAPTMLTVAPWQVPFGDSCGFPDGRGNLVGGDVPRGADPYEVYACFTVVEGKVDVGNASGDTLWRSDDV